MVMQVRRTLTVGATPTGLAEGQISVGMADQPPTGWVGVPTSVNPAGVIPITGLVRTVAGAPQPAGALGQLWWDEDGAQLYVYTGSEWVVAVNPPIPDLSGFLALAGGAMTGPIELAGDAEQALEPVSLQQMQNALAPFALEVSTNFFDNGAFTVTQRLFGPWTANTAYTADRWRITIFGGDALSVSIVPLSGADIASLGYEFAVNALQTTFTGTNTATSSSSFEQRIEQSSWRFLAGKTVTISFYARATVGSPRIGLILSEFFGTGGTPAADAYAPIGSTPALSTGFTRYTFTFAVPAIAGRAFGTNGDGCLRLMWALSTSPLNTSWNAWSGGIGVQSGTVVFWGMRLELGDHASDYQYTPIDVETTRCQRFYQLVQPNLTGYQLTGATFGYGFPLSTRMRADPTATTTAWNAINLSAVTFSATTLTFIANGTVAATGVVQLSYTVALSADL